MDDKKEKALQTRFKFLVPPKDDQTPYYVRGMECCDGWFDLLWDLFEQIEKELDSKSEFRVSQVKEKYGGLRVYVWGGSDKVQDLISAAEKKSETICEDCGKPGKLNQVCGWWATECKKCLAKRKRRMKKMRGRVT